MLLILNKKQHTRCQVYTFHIFDYASKEMHFHPVKLILKKKISFSWLIGFLDSVWQAHSNSPGRAYEMTFFVCQLRITQAFIDSMFMVNKLRENVHTLLKICKAEVERVSPSPYLLKWHQSISTTKGNWVRYMPSFPPQEHVYVCALICSSHEIRGFWRNEDFY